MSLISKRKKLIQIVVVVGVYIALLLPYLCTIFQAVPTSDDFCMILKADEANFFVATVNKYMNWSGEFFYFFLQYFANPLAYAPLDSHLYGIVLCVIFLLLIFSFRYFNKAWMTCLFEFNNEFYIELLSTFIIAILLFAKNYHEVFYWFVGSSYAIGYVFLYIAVGAMIHYYSQNMGKIRHYVMLVVFGIFCCNAINMCVVTAISYLALLIWYLKREKKKLEFMHVAPLIAYVAMGCITVFAPGNFARKSNNASDVILKAFVKAITCNIRKLYSLFENNSVFYMFVCLFLIGFVYNCIHRKNFIRMWSLLAVLVISLFGTLFPVAYGYGDMPLLNNRVSFILDVLYVSILGIFVFWLGTYISYRLNVTLNNKDYVVLALVMICSFYAIVIKCRGFIECEYVNQIENVKKVSEERELWCDIYNDIYNSSDKEIVIEVADDRYVRSGVIENPQLDENPGFWINSEIRRYFKKNSISVFLNEN